jgi:hypothetical protein
MKPTRQNFNEKDMQNAINACNQGQRGYLKESQP